MSYDDWLDTKVIEAAQHFERGLTLLAIAHKGCTYDKDMQDRIAAQMVAFSAAIGDLRPMTVAALYAKYVGCNNA